MKKILLLFGLIVLSIGSYAQTQITAIKPYNEKDKRPLEYKASQYEIQFIGTTPVSVNLKCKRGNFIYANGLHIDTISSLNTIAYGNFTVNIIWGSAGEGSLTVEPSSGQGLTRNVDIEKPSVSISGLSSVRYGDNVEYTLSYNPNMKIKSVAWSNTSDFKSIGGQTGENLKIEVTNNTNKNISKAISVIAKTDDGTFSASKDVTIQAALPTLAINANKSVICSGESLTYSINAPSGATITWQAGANMTLVSGQGTTSATFKGVLPDKGKPTNNTGIVKAVITYSNGVPYTVENSELWIGPPPFQIISEATTDDYPPYYAEFSFFEMGITNIQWTNFYPAESEKDISIIRLGNTIKVTFVVPERIATASGDFKFQAIVSNKCGSKTKDFILHPAKNPIYPIKRISSLKQEEENIQIKTITSSTPVSIKINSFGTGELVYQKKNVINFNINDTNLKKGIYIVTTTDDKGNITQDKVMKTTD
ncbi:MAG: T9SS type A sorting domain-containing protein [Dysgonomonas sp.]